MILTENEKKIAKAKTVAHSFFKNYRGYGSLFQVEKDEKKLVKNDMQVLFVSEKQDWNFCVVLKTDDKAWKPFYFPIYKDAYLTVEENNQESKVSFNFNLNEHREIQVRVEFKIFNEDFEAASKFMNIFTRLLWQTQNQKLYSFAGKEFNFNSLCHKLGTKDVESEIGDAILALFDNLKDEKKVQFLGIGDLYSKGEGDRLNQDQDGKILYHKEVNSSLYYIINEDMNDISWTDSKNNMVVSFVFRFKDTSAATTLAVNMSIDILTSNKKMALEDILEDKNTRDWNQFYGQCTDDDILDDDDESEDYEGYYENEPMPLKFGTESTFLNHDQTDFTNMVSAKTIDRCFGIKDSIISAYKDNADDGEEIEYILDLPKLTKDNGDEFHPGECLIAGGDTRMLMLEKGKSNSVFLLDMEKGKIVQEMRGSGQAPIQDISLGSKLDFLEPVSTFYGCEGQNLFQMDPRTSNSIVNSRPYKTNYMFAKISAAADGRFAVGSANGQIRMYNQVGGNAKNLIPSFNGEPIIDLDATKDGKFLLATTPSNVMLIKTMQDGKSGFDYMFRKSEKPVPVSLKIHANSLAKHGIARPVFKGAKFNQSDSKREAYIVAHTENHLVVWSMRKLRSRNYATTAIKSFEDKIVQKDFKFNTHSIIAALPKNLKYQKTIAPNKL